MYRLRRISLPFCAAFVILILPLSAGADPAPSNSEASILLLRNGELIRGRITRAADHYDVTQNDGEIHVQTSEVEAVCRDLADCYRVKRAHLSDAQIDDHLALAEWCIRNALVVEAAAALQAARAINAAHPKIALLDRRLKLTASAPAESIATKSPTSAEPSGEDLDRTVRGLPPRAVEQFTIHIQPLLLNHCSTAGCHGPQSSTSFHLLRLPSNRNAGRRSTQRNLQMTLSLIDRNEPGNSRLLTAPASPHGTAKTPIFNKHEASHYRKLVEWVYLVSSQTPAPLPEEEPTTTEKPPRRLASGAESGRPVPRRQGAEPFATDTAASKSAVRAGQNAPAATEAGKPDVVPATAEFPSGTPQPAATLGGSVKRGAQVEQFVPKDDFDPEIFNRQP